MLCFFFLIVLLYFKLQIFRAETHKIGSDRIFHLYMIKSIKENNFKIPRKEERILGGINDFSYPYMYHYILSFLPGNILKMWEKYSGFLFDTLISLALFAVVYNESDGDIEKSIISAIFYLTVPIFNWSFYEPRSYSLTPRNFSQFLFSLMSILMYHNSGNLYLLVSVAVAYGVFLALNLLSSQFFLQFFLLVLLPSSFSSCSLQLTNVITIALLLMLPVTGFFEQIKSHFHNMVWFHDRFKEGSLNENKKSNKRLTLKDFLYDFVWNNHFVRNIFFSYYILIVLFKFADFNQNITLTLICFFSVFSFILTSVGRFKVLGSAGRYLEYATIPALLLIIHESNNIDNFSEISQILVAFHLVFIFYVYHTYKKNKLSYTRYDPQIKKDLQCFYKDKVILPINQTDRFWILYNTSLKVVGFFIKMSHESKWRKKHKFLFSCYPYINIENLDNIVSKFGVNYILVKKTDFSKEKYDRFKKYKKNRIYSNHYLFEVK